MALLTGGADKTRTSRRRFVEQPSTAGEWAHNISRTESEAAFTPIRQVFQSDEQNAMWRFESSQPSQIGSRCGAGERGRARASLVKYIQSALERLCRSESRIGPIRGH